MKKKVPIKNLYLIAVILVGLIALAIGSTYAMFVVEEELLGSVSLSAGDLSYDSDLTETVEVTVAPGKTEYFDLVINNNTNASVNYSSWYITSLDSSEYEIGSTSSDSHISSGTLSASGSFTLTVGIKNKTNSEVTFLLGVTSSTEAIILDDSMNTIPSEELSLGNAVDHITALYTNASKITADNGNATHGIITYNLAPDENLMNDRLGSMATDIDGGNIRYYGAEPKNYIYFNCTDYSNQNASTCELWRIIGVFETEDEYGNIEKRIKIIRNEPLFWSGQTTTTPKLSWDSSASTLHSGNGINQWGESEYKTGGSYTGADLMKLLNPGYENNMDYISGSTDLVLVNNSLYWNHTSGTCYVAKNNVTKSYDFTNEGLKDSSKSVISTVVWNTGASRTGEIYSHEMYLNERSTTVNNSPDDGVIRTTSWEGKIALAYPSDYGYGADFSICNKYIGQNSNGYNSDTNCRSNYMNTVMQYTSQFLTTFSGSSQGLFTVYAGNVSICYAQTHACGTNGVAGFPNPVLYLNTDVSLAGGTGEMGSPYKISVS